MNDVNDILQQSWEFQKNFTDKWLSNLKSYSDNFNSFDPTRIAEWYEKTVKATQSMLGEWAESNPWDMVTPQASVQSDIYNKLMASTKVYEDIYNIYSNFVNKQTFPGMKEINEFLAGQKSVYDKLINDIFSPLFPQASKALFASSNKVLEQLKDISENFAGPFVDAARTNTEAVKNMIEGSFEQYKEAYRSIQELYKNSYGQYLETLGIPSLIQDNPALASNLEAFKNMYLAQTQLLAYVKDVAQNNMAEVIRQYQDFVKPNGEPKTINDFVKLFIDVNDKVFIDLMGQDEFCDLFANYVKQFAGFKKDFSNLLEQNLSWLPFTPLSRMDYVYKELHDLRRQVYYSNKAIDELKEQIEGLKKAATKASKTAAAPKATKASK